MSEFLNLAMVYSLQVLLEEGSFRSAATRLHVTPPALTQQIKRLESAVGYELVKRGSHPTVLTARGENFMLHARESLEASSRALGLELRQALRVGFINGFPRSHDEAFLVRFREQNPEVEIQLVQLNWGEQITRLLAGDVDVSLARPPFVQSDGFEGVRVHREPRVVAVPESSSLARKSSLLLEEVERLPVVRAQGIDLDWTKYWVVDPRPSGIPVKYGAWAATMEEALAAVAMSGNVMITAASVAERYSYTGVTYVPLDDVEYCDVLLCFRTGERRRNVRAIIDSVGAAAR